MIFVSMMAFIDVSPQCILASGPSSLRCRYLQVSQSIYRQSFGCFAPCTNLSYGVLGFFRVKEDHEGPGLLYACRLFLQLNHAIVVNCFHCLGHEVFSFDCTVADILSRINTPRRSVQQRASPAAHKRFAVPFPLPYLPALLFPEFRFS